MSAAIVQPRREVSQCYRCGLPAVQPKLLPCLHTFCLECLKTGALIERRERSPEGLIRMQCPECSSEFVVPREGLSGLPPDIFVDRLVKMQKGLCDVCSEDKSSVPSASKYCPSCCQGLCERCAVDHSRQKLLKAHKLVDFSVQIALQEARLHPSNMCTKHPTVLSTQFYCLTCQRFVCGACLLEDHMEHEWRKWEKVVDEFRRNLRRNIDQGSVLMGDVVKKKEETVDKERHRFIHRTTEIESEIRDRCRQLRKRIDGHEYFLLDELNSLKEARLLQMDQEITRKFGRYLVQLDTYKHYCTAVTENGSPNEIDWAVNDLNLREKFEELKNQSGHIFADSNTHLDSFAEVSFKLPNEDATLKTRALIGLIGELTIQAASPKDPLVEDLLRIDSEDANRPTRACAAKADRHARLNTKGKEVWGVTAMNRFVYVLSEDSVFIYEPENSVHPVEKIDIISKQKYLTDIAASSLNNCLYVIDQGDSSTTFKESCIWKIEKDVRDNKYSVSKWVTESVRLYTLSVSPKGHVTVPMSYKGTNKLNVYRSDRALIKTINLTFMYPKHAIELANGNFVVSFGKYEAYLCEINGSGKVVRSFSDKLLNHPYHVAFFVNDDLLIADSKNNRVLWLDLNLNVKQELLTKEKDGIIEPRRICYAKQNNLLLIVYSGTDGKRVVDLYDPRRWLK